MAAAGCPPLQHLSATQRSVHLLTSQHRHDITPHNTTRPHTHNTPSTAALSTPQFMTTAPDPQNTLHRRAQRKIPAHTTTHQYLLILWRLQS
mmetsp:Transcript_54728/g.119142  ORF Transcript_54728/g.119142 Transcript_54728/m.119142 type:complete len:92 (+) Transcript_54728:252-527(+)